MQKWKKNLNEIWILNEHISGALEKKETFTAIQFYSNFNAFMNFKICWIKKELEKKGHSGENEIYLFIFIQASSRQQYTRSNTPIHTPIHAHAHTHTHTHTWINLQKK